MAVTVNDIKIYKALYNNDDAGGNGGKIADAQIIDNMINNLFPNVTEDERVAGITRYRKFFVKNLNTENKGLVNWSAGIATPSPAADFFRVKPGTDTDTQADAASYTDWAGAGILTAAATAADTSITAVFEASDGVKAGDAIKISDGASSEYATVDTGGVSWAGNTATITLTAGIGFNPCFNG